MEEHFEQIPTFTDQENPQPQRPFTLSLFCVLSFINAVYQFFWGIIMFVTYDKVKELSDDDNYLELMEKMGANSDEVNSAMANMFAVSRNYYILTALLYVASFVGVYYMWKLLKKGFHIYAIAQILILIVEVLMFTNVTGTSPWGSVIITAVFIAMYYAQYKRVME